MAYRNPEQLTCPSCAKRAELVWLVGIGPNTKPGEGAAYVQILDPGPWLEQTTNTAPAWHGTLTCPACGATVLTRP